MPSWKKIILSGSNAALNSLNVTTSITASVVSASNGFTGSLFGTASWAQSASNAINSQTASFINPLRQDVFITGAVVLSGSSQPELRVIGETQFTGSVNSLNGFTGSLFGTSSWANTASVALNLPPGTYGITSSWARNSLTSSLALLSSHSWVITDGTNSEVIGFNTAVTFSGGGGTTASYNPARDVLTISSKNYIAGTALDLTLSGLYDATFDVDLTELSSSTTITSSNSFVIISGSNQRLISASLIGLNIFNNNLTLFSLPITASVISASGGITGSLFGTSSWAISASQAVSSSYAFNATSASHALTASYVNHLRQNVIITGSTFVSGGISTQYIDFDINAVPAFQTGRVNWVDDTKTLAIDTELSGFQVEVGHQNVIRVRNNTGATILRGRATYISGSSGNRPLIYTSSYEIDPTSAGTVGLVAADISDNGNGYVISNGLIRDVNTTAFTAGAVLYLSSSGQLSTTVPVAPLHAVRMGKVITSAVAGIIHVDVDNGYEIGELHDVVDNTTNTTYGSLLVKSGSVWKDGYQLTGSYGLTGSLNATSFTGSLFGTASWANNSITASYILNAVSSSFASTASFINPLRQDVFITGAVVLSGSTQPELRVIGETQFTGSVNSLNGFTGSLFGTASWATNVLTASFVNPLRQNVLITGSVNISGSITSGDYNLSNPVSLFNGWVPNTIGTPLIQPFVVKSINYPVRLYNHFANLGDNRFFDSVGNNRFHGRSDLIGVSVNGGSFSNTTYARLFNGDYDEFNVLQLPLSSSASVKIDLNRYGYAGVNGITYPQGQIHALFYDVQGPLSMSIEYYTTSSVSGLVTSSIFQFTPYDYIDQGPGAASNNYFNSWRVDVPQTNGLIGFTLFITASSLIQTYFSELEYLGSRIDYNGGGNFSREGGYVKNINVRNNAIITGSLIVSSSAIVTGSLNVSSSAIIIGSLTVGTSSLGPFENTLTLGARDNVNEGGQLGLNAPGGTYTSASFIDNYQNQTRLLRGTNAGSDAVVALWNMHSKQMQLPAYNSTTAFTATTLVGILGFDANGNILTTNTSSGGGGGGVTILNNTDNYLITATGTANTLNGESNLQFSGSSLTVTGNITASGTITAQANNQMYFRGGDDAELWDINVSNTLGIYGQQNADRAGLKLGSSGPTLFGSASRFGIGTTTPTSASLTVDGNIWATSFTGSLLGTSSWAQSASNAINAGTASFLPVGTYSITSSWATNALTSSFINNLNQNLSITGAVVLSGSSLPELRVIGDTQFTGSVNSFNGYTGSLFGTASWALNVVGGGGGGVTINNNVDNYLVTATGTANTLDGESTLTFDGTTLTIGGNISAVAIDTRNDPSTTIGDYAVGSHIARDWAIAGNPALTAGNIVYFSGSSHWANAQANTTGSSTRVLGVVTSNIDPNEIVLQGTVTVNTDLATYQIGQPVYLSPLTAGRVTNIPPSSSGHVARYVGWVVDTNRDQIYFNPDFTYIQL